MFSRGFSGWWCFLGSGHVTQNGQAKPPRLAVEVRPLSNSHVAIAMAVYLSVASHVMISHSCGVIRLYEAIVSVFRPQAIIGSY